MALYLIGLGLGDEKDITLNGLEAIKRCSKVYLENYTSKLSSQNIKDMEKLYQKKIILADRKQCEDKASEIISEAKGSDIALLIIGSPFSATTHVEFLIEAKKQKVQCSVIENTSILTAVGITGLSLYKFGRTTTIPFDSKDITSPCDILKDNQKQGLHTLFLLDIQKDRMMTAKDGLSYLLKQGLDKNTLVIACSALGSSKQKVQVGTPESIDLKNFPQCFIIPGKLNFKEKEALRPYKK